MSGEFALTAGKTPVTQIVLADSPKDGDRWNPGDPVTIRWKFTGSPGQTVKLALIKKEEGSVTELPLQFPSAFEGKGSYEWKVPVLKSGNDYYVGIVSNSNAFYQTWEPIPLVLLRRDRSGFGRSFFAKKGGITLRAEPINESNLYLFHEGTQTQAYSILGAHPTEQNGQRAHGFPCGAAC